ncbi:1-acyl-sn-glycerol-3-phosphate acyltransferase [Pseudenhygromyxa sp. WMMC2535]|uniref:lysophospholipid acyltransferase family protein n=1 Tax=Pseudenhygromyxa sp. WMMC2535 TaxID=2712867 RepID=UPI001558180D|nr:lysophospholipid acyltransferase family protein [Pseudenhygromyxa sp. WMMC2535]NVB41033.1 1-acyl-sn-glycerol-3-phosphate acyltransferase [Pseudenhygromyxa sp. WMMC2535]
MPKLAKQLRDNLRAPARGAGLIAWTALMLGAAEAHKAVDRKLGPGTRQDQLFERYMRTWTGAILTMNAIDVEIVGALPPASAGPRMVISNHRSAVDIPILLTHFGGSVLSRADLEDWPLLGLAAQKAQTIFVERDNQHSGAQAIRAIRAQLQRGRTVNIFPEGTTFAGDEVRPFNAGAFVATRGLDVDFVPVGLAYPPGCEYVEDSFVAHAQAIASRPRTPVVMRVGEVQRFSGKAARAAALAETLRAQVQVLVDEARQHALEGRRA